MNQLLHLVRGSPYINADETGWREDGRNGYIWTFSTKDVRYFIYRRSRSGEIPRLAIGSEYEGVVVTDCYAGYNGLLADRQVCWAHLARDLHKLKERNADNEAVISWADEVKSIWAERALRPAVITRKVCGGTRSEKGSETKMTLMSLFGTWHI